MGKTTWARKMGAVFKFVMALTLIWAAVSAMSVDMSSQQGFLGNVHGCYWDGNSPICNGTCREGWTKKAADRCGDGKCCLTGMKAYCCPTIETPEDCYWDGTSPFCAGGCKVIARKYTWKIFVETVNAALPATKSSAVVNHRNFIADTNSAKYSVAASMYELIQFDKW